MALTEKEFKQLYHDAFTQWAKKEAATPSGVLGIRSGTQQAADLWLSGRSSASNASILDSAYRDYAADPASWVARASEGRIGEFPKAVVGFLDPSKFQEQDPAAVQAQTDSATAERLMREFAQYMMSPVDPNDPYVQSVTRMASAAAAQDAQHRGLTGGYATGNVARAATSALTGVQLQRQQIGQQALAQSAGLSLQQQQLAQQQYNNQYQAQLAQMQQGYQAGLGNAQSVGGVLGGVVGGVAGGIATAYTGNPMFLQAGLGAGSQIGAGIGGASYGGPPPLSYTPPSRRAGGAY